MQNKVDASPGKNIILWGATGQAKVLRECLSYYGYNVVALFDNNESLKSPFKDIPLFYRKAGFDKWLSTVDVVGNHIECLVAVGGSRGRDRHEIQRFIEGRGIQIISIIHPTAVCLESAKLGKGSQILANATVCVDVEIGEACIINSAASIDHDSILGDGVHLCPGSHLAGNVTIGAYSTIGTGAVVIPRIVIGSNVIVGAGAVVTKDVADNGIVYGNPARYIRDNVFDENGL